MYNFTTFCMVVGNTAADQKEPTPFIIEWIPDILPKSRIGELRIKFEYGHQRNGHVERRVEEIQTAIEQVWDKLESTCVYCASKRGLTLILSSPIALNCVYP